MFNLFKKKEGGGKNQFVFTTESEGGVKTADTVTLYFEQPEAFF